LIGFIHTPLLFRKSIKSCLVRNFTAGDCVTTATRGIEAEAVEGLEEPDGVEGLDEEDGVEGKVAACDEDAAAEEGLDEAAPVSEPPLALDSPVV